MVKFYEISTDEFKPLSFDNQYLFNRYDQVANFLAKYLDKSYKDIVARPIQKNYTIEWYSQFEGLKDVRTDSSLTIVGYQLYYQFLEAINSKIIELSRSKDSDNQDWANILSNIFNENDNFVFCNGKEIAIVWGWGFNNNDIYKPSLDATPSIPELKQIEEKELIRDHLIEPEIEDLTANAEEVDEEEEIEEEVEVEELVETQDDSNNKFFYFLKWFASKYWWILIILITMIAFVFTLKALKYS